MKGIPTHFLKLKQKMDSMASTIKRMNFVNFLVLVETVDVHYPIIFSILVAGIGIPLNTTAQNKFPLFLPFVFALYFTLAAAYYSIRKVQKFFANKSNFIIHSAGEHTILVARKKYERIAKSNYNFAFPVIFGGSIAVLTSQVLGIQLDSSIRLYCLSALAVILAICAIGFFQYFYFILFLLKLARDAEQIKAYDNALPAKTDWLVDLASMANSYSTMYFLVGLVYIYTFLYSRSLTTLAMSIVL